MNSAPDQLIPGTSIGTLPIALQAYLIARTFLKRRTLVCWLVDHTDALYTAQEDLSCFLEARHIGIFHACDTRPYQDDSPSHEVTGNRIASLYRILSRDPLVLITTIEAILPLTLDKAELAESAIPLKTGQDLDREELARALVHRGYTREALVDEIGQFSIRGSIMDIFSPGMDEPVRLDLFGDTIEEIRSFDHLSQRSKAHREDALMLPASEVLLERGHMKEARARLRRLKDPLALSLIDDIEQGIHTPGIESYLPFFYTHPVSPLAYLPQDTLVICPDRENLSELWEMTFSTYERAYTRVRDSRPGLLPPDKLLLGREAFITALEGFDTRITTSLEGPSAGVSYQAMPPEIRGAKDAPRSIDYLATLKAEGRDVRVYMSSTLLAERVEYALEIRGLDPQGPEQVRREAPPPTGGRICLVKGALSAGFILLDTGLAVISGDELFGEKRHRKTRQPQQPLLNPFTQLNVGDAVVHRENGIGIFKGVERLELEGVKSDFVLLEYLGGDKLYVPVYRLSLLQRYIGDPDVFLIDKLGGSRWSRAKDKARESVAQLANELIGIYARREDARGHAYDTHSAMIKDFEAQFPFEETEDQLRSIEETYADLAKNRPMDRLICGDVGYGKTEVALRAAFVAVMAGRQVAVLVPTTLLARQHSLTFRERLAAWPVRIEALTSFSSLTAGQLILDDLAHGKVDILIGTQALLSEKVRFRDLGLLVVDEEHRFGVRHKERIKALRAEVDILTLSATPIPRTLNMAISGIRDLSIIETPPAERKSVETVISRFDPDVIAAAIERELARGGQVFFVHNKVATIEAMARRLQAIHPRARIGVVHGQLPKAALNRTMEKFVDRGLNVLVTSAIISSGIDISNANTIIINRADMFGMADLYQLRGRVGRAKRKGYALLLIPEQGQITRDAHKRLAAIKEYASLGAGFQMALRDMEIRGVGDILGKSQWGQVTAVGYELYQQLLKEAVDKLQGRQTPPEVDPEIRIQADAYLPEDYCPDQHLRLGLYRRLSSADDDELELIHSELQDLYGPPPAPVQALLRIAQIRVLMRGLRIKKLEVLKDRLRLYLLHDTRVQLDALIKMVEDRHGRLYQDGRADIPVDAQNITLEIRDILSSLVPAPDRGLHPCA